MQKTKRNKTDLFKISNVLIFYGLRCFSSECLDMYMVQIDSLIKESVSYFHGFFETKETKTMYKKYGN